MQEGEVKEPAGQAGAQPAKVQPVPIDVPAQVFQTYLEDLQAAGASEELVARLRTVLLVDKVYTERAINAAIFPEVWDL